MTRMKVLDRMPAKTRNGIINTYFEGYVWRTPGLAHREKSIEVLNVKWYDQQAYVINLGENLDKHFTKRNSDTYKQGLNKNKRRWPESLTLY